MVPRAGSVSRITKGKSAPTGHYLPCPRALELHAQLQTACHVMRGPKAFWLECPFCGTREFIAPKLLDARDENRVYGMTLEQAISKGLVPTP